MPALRAVLVLGAPYTVQNTDIMAIYAHYNAGSVSLNTGAALSLSFYTVLSVFSINWLVG